MPDKVSIQDLAGLDAAQRKVVTRWLTLGQDSFRTQFKALPAATDIFIRFKKGRSPVPWAHTYKADTLELHFYISPDATEAALNADWTLYHEFAHLALPYVGEQGRWWAEGFASYMQYFMMRDAGMLDVAPQQKLADKWQRYAAYFHQDAPIAAQASDMILRRQYAPAYWAGAKYFAHADYLLRQQGSSMAQQVRRYLACCYQPQQSLKRLLRELDSALSDPVFVPLYRLATERANLDWFVTSANFSQNLSKLSAPPL